MCGIAGIVGEDTSKFNIDAMLDSLSHRGPDATGKYYNSLCYLGHNRLSIIDLSKNANQPYYSNNNRYVLVFNGAIYNYLELKHELKNNYDFKTNSDTEVLLAAYLTWGKDCLHKLNGMFAFAIWDNLKKSLFAARDRFGVKPFYYAHKNKTFYFASEIKALFKAEILKRPNEDVWSSYFLTGSYGLPQETFWEDIHQLAAGHFLTYKDDTLEIEKWYLFEQQIHLSNRTEKEVKEEYATLLLDAVKLRFRSDVPVGFNLSGGLDSSMLLSLVNDFDSSKNINAFSFYCNDKKYDELPWVEKMINQTKNPLTTVLFESEDVQDYSKIISLAQDEPFGGIPTLAYAKIFKEASKQGIKVLLDGQGMDEQWAGYDYYFKESNATIQGVSNSPFREKMFHKDLLNEFKPFEYPKFFKEYILNLQYRDLFYTKIPRALRFNDRISMLYGTELREPFLDYRLVELAFSQPINYKIKNGIQKYILREIAKGKYDKKIINTPKRPLQTPQREWLGKDLKYFVNEQIESLLESKVNHWFNKDEVVKEWKLYSEGNNESSFHIWQLLNTSLINF